MPLPAQDSGTATERLSATFCLLDPQVPDACENWNLAAPPTSNSSVHPFRCPCSRGSWRGV